MKKLFTIVLLMFTMSVVFAQQNTILVELTGNVRNKDYMTSMMIFKEFQQFNDLEIISYNRYSSDPFGNALVFDSPRRLQYYGQPFIVINGSKYDIPFYVIDTTEYIRSLLEFHYNDDMELTFDIGGSVEYLHTHNLYRLKYDIPERLDKEYYVHMAVTEDVKYNWFGKDSIYGITRKMMPTYNGMHSTEINYSYNHSEFFPNTHKDLKLIIFAQTDDGTIIGCKSMLLEDLNLLHMNEIFIDNDIRVYPNPAIQGSKLTIEYPTETKHIDIIDALGRRVLLNMETKEAYKTHVYICSQYSPGIYYVRVSTDSQMFTFKLVIQ